MSDRAFRFFAAAVAGVSAVVLVLTQLVGDGQPEVTAPSIEPLPAPSDSGSLPTETIEPSSSPHDGPLIYTHDFSSPENGLLGGQSSDSGTNEFGTRSAAYTDHGTLLVQAQSDLNTYVAGASTDEVVGGSQPLVDLTDVSLEATARPLAVGESGAWGLACRREQGVGSFYFAFIGLDGAEPRAGIIRQNTAGGAWTTLSRANELPPDLTIGAGTTNTLRLDCVGDRITLSADGQEIVEATDDSYAFGAVSLFVNPAAHGSAQVEFDDLEIREATR
jgi:hypothetical protein